VKFFGPDHDAGISRQEIGRESDAEERLDEFAIRRAQAALSAGRDPANQLEAAFGNARLVRFTARPGQAPAVSRKQIRAKHLPSAVEQKRGGIFAPDDAAPDPARPLLDPGGNLGKTRAVADHPFQFVTAVGDFPGERPCIESADEPGASQTGQNQGDQERETLNHIIAYISISPRRREAAETPRSSGRIAMRPHSMGRGGRG